MDSSQYTQRSLQDDWIQKGISKNCAFLKSQILQKPTGKIKFTTYSSFEAYMPTFWIWSITALHCE